jgi:hypothetical protein
MSQTSSPDSAAASKEYRTIATSEISEIRKGQAPPRLQRDEFGARFRAAFFDPAFRREDESIARIEDIAWDAYTDGRKAPITEKQAEATLILTINYLAIGSRLSDKLMRLQPLGLILLRHHVCSSSADRRVTMALVRQKFQNHFA